LLKYSYILLITCLLSLGAFAQQNDKRIERAKKKYEAKEYIGAIDLFRKLYAEDANAYVPVKYIANSYRKINRYDQAETFYTLVVNSIYATAEDHLSFGQTLRANGKLAAAKEQFEKFATKSQNRVLANLLLQSMDEVKTWENQPKNFIVEAGEGLNSAEAEYGLIAFQDKYYITSNREKNYNSPESFSWNGSAYTSIYSIDTMDVAKSDVAFLEVKGKLNSNYHDGPMTVSEDQSKCVIMRINNELRGKDFINRMKLFEGEYKEGKWRNFKELPFNSDSYHTGHPTYGKDENELFFISDKTGGQGGTDLYRVERKEGVWGEVENLGPTLNTSKNESFPYYRKNKLYYSSDGFSGYGGYDLFVSENKGKWQAPNNLKRPINSNRDDFGIYFITDTTGYYASNRDGGKGKDDIYKFIYSKEPLIVGLSGVLEYKTSPVAGTKVVMLGANDSIIAFEYTDSRGRFRFDNLPYSENVILKIATNDESLIEDGRLYLTDERGAKIKLLNRLKNGSFMFKALKPEEIRLNTLIELEDTKLISGLSYKGQVYKKLPGDFTAAELVYLVDEQGTVIDSMLTDLSGKFQFQKLGLDDGRNYFVQMAEEDPELSLALINESNRFYTLDQSDSGRFVIMEEELANINAGFIGVVGRMEAYGKPLKFSRVDIYDKNDSLIAKVFTNELGEFQYYRLTIDEEYYFRAKDIKDETSLNTKLYVVDEYGDPLFLIKRMLDARYVFNALPIDDYNSFRELEESSVPLLVGLKGQIFKKLQGDFSDSIKVYLLDEGGDIVDSMFTDNQGYFNFEKLKADREYSFKLSESKGMNLALLDADNLIIEQAIINDQGNFTYKRLTYQVASFEPLELVDAELVEDEFTHEMYGQVYQKLPGDFQEGMEVYIYNKSGDIVGTAFTDRQGKFEFKKLSADESYYFKIENHERDFQLLTLDEDENILGKTIKNVNGRFKFRKLGTDEHIILLEEELDHQQIIYFDQKKIELDEFTVYYRFDSVKLNTASKIKLKSFAELIIGQPFKVEVHSYTDKRGTVEYNQKLSQQRTNSVIAFLTLQGIKSDELIKNYYGELNPVVDCGKQRCDNADHALNRRTVVKLIKIE
jgi:outer membrane protein OmpA-like peptidoglycan-associated protein